jgi:CubicO group peptidase (beta-lactamase class C family)
VDADPDLTWIDRETAMSRILAQPLLFAPGKGNAHSHSAWVMLAAVVEKVSGQSYGDFVTQELFKPAGMTSTYLHEGLRKVPDKTIAIGYGMTDGGKDNSPKYWGRTSWLVMGSGGMSSTAEDLSRFFTTVHHGTLLSKEALKKFPEGAVLVGGDDRGFLCMHGESGDDSFVLCSNVHKGPNDLGSKIGRELGKMVLKK